MGTVRKKKIDLEKVVSEGGERGILWHSPQRTPAKHGGKGKGGGYVAVLKKAKTLAAKDPSCAPEEGEGAAGLRGCGWCLLLA